MDLRLRITLITLVGLLAVAVWTFPSWWPLLRTEESVPQAFPGLADSEQIAFIQQLSQGEQDAYLEMYDEDPAMALEMVRARIASPIVSTLEPDAMPPKDSMTVLSTGDFGVVDELHSGQGTVTIYQRPDLTRILVFSDDFQVQNGPSLKVIFARDPNPLTGVEVGTDYVEAIPNNLQGTRGPQLYAVPEGVDLNEYRSVVIFEDTYNIVFSTAPLR